MPCYNFSFFATGVVLISLVLFAPMLNASQGQSDMTSGITTRMKEGGIALDIYQNKIMTFGGNVKNIILLLPNEGHESPAPPQEQRLINQPYVPANIIIGPNTQIAWINGDVGHTHSVTVLDKDSKQVFSSGKFGFNSVTTPLVLNDSGKFTYSESNVNKDDPKFVMEGTIIVQENPSSTNQLPETVGFLMVPTKDLDKHVSELTGKGIEVLDNYTFKDLRGGQKGTGPNQSLLLLGSTNGQEELILAMESITHTLPYS
jgi:plastocyanin